LEVADVIREMIMSANGRPGMEYAIVLTGDGRLVIFPQPCAPSPHTPVRVVTGGRVTTFVGLRIVYLEGHNSLGSDAIWPIAIIERPEKRGPFRLYSRPLRLQLDHVQKSGLLLPADYAAMFDLPDAPAPRDVVAPVVPPVSPPVAVRPVFNYQKDVLPDEETDGPGMAKFMEMSVLEASRRRVWRERRVKRSVRRLNAGMYISHVAPYYAGIKLLCRDVTSRILR